MVDEEEMVVLFVLRTIERHRVAASNRKGLLIEAADRRAATPSAWRRPGCCDAGKIIAEH